MGKLFERIKPIIHTVRREGLKAAFKKYGWKLAMLVVLYYLIRDVTLYIILPALIISIPRSC